MNRDLVENHVGVVLAEKPPQKWNEQNPFEVATNDIQKDIFQYVSDQEADFEKMVNDESKQPLQRRETFGEKIVSVVDIEKNDEIHKANEGTI